MTTPTIRRTVNVYRESARIDQIKCCRPCAATVRNTLSGVRRFVRQLEIHQILGDRLDEFDTPWDIPTAVITPRLVRKYLASLLDDGYKPITAVSYVQQLQQLFARWTVPYYEDRGWKIPQFPVFARRATPARYNRPTAGQLAGVKAWYETLTRSAETVAADRHLWFAATMMLEFAVRNGDILRLKRSNFTESDGHAFLCYVPHKTAHSSGRTVRWPVHPDIWTRLEALFALSGGETPVMDGEEVFRRLNGAMRTLGFTGTKGAYELRKICIDHIYQRFGAEMAVSISGDDIRTIMRFYADPAQPNAGDTRILDLL